MQGSKCHGNLWNLVLLKKILERHHWLVNPLKFIRNNMGRCVSKAFNGRDNNSQFVFVFFYKLDLFIYFKFIYFKWKWSCSVVSSSLQPHGLQPVGFLRPWDFPGKGTGVGCHFLLHRVFLTQGSNPGLPALQADALPSEPLCLGYLIEG